MKTKNFNESSEATCDMCGQEGHEDGFDIVPGYGNICPDCQEQVKKMGGAKGEPISSKTMNAESKKPENWMGVPHSQFLYHGDWSDPEVYYKGFYLNYWDLIEGPLEVYREEHPEDKDEKGFDDWFEKEGPATAQGYLDDMVYAYTGDLPSKNWLGIKGAYLLNDYKTEKDYVFYNGWRIEMSDIQDECGFYDEYEEFREFLEMAESDRKNKIKVKAALDKCKSQGELYCEGFKEMWDSVKKGASDLGNKAKAGLKKMGKAIGDVFKGPFRKGDHIVMKGEDGEEFKGTIKSYDMGDKVYEVMLGNAVNEGLQEDVLDMPDRVTELEQEIEKLWVRLGDLPGDKNEVVLNLISKYVELEQLEPGRVDFEESTMVNEGLEEDVLNMPDRNQEIDVQLKKNEEELYNMLSDEYKDNEFKFHHHSKFDELLEERDALVEELCGCRGLMKEETREERAYLRSIGEYDSYLGKKKSAKKPAKRKWGGASKKSAKKPVRTSMRHPVAKKEYKYSFSASGFGTKTYSFPSEEECLKEMKQDAEATAMEYGGEVQWWDDKECVVTDEEGQELGTFEYLGARR